MKKILIIAAVLLAIVAAAVYFSNTNLLNEWRAEREYNARKAAQDEYLTGRQAELDALVDLYKADTYGGATPQETWSMFIKALEAGDTDLAAMYFVPEKQEERKTYFGNVQKVGNMELMLEDIGFVIKGSYKESDKNKFYIYTGDINDTIGFSHILTYNQFTNIWKISDF